MPDEVIIGIVAERIAQSDCENGFILDGVPRTMTQARALEEAGLDFDAVLSIEISDKEIEERMSGRRVCENCGLSYHVVTAPPRIEGICDNCGEKLAQRKDDAPETVRDRLSVYHKETEPLKGFYEDRGVLHSVDNRPTIPATTEAIFKELGIC